jgi:hypothetical protein
VVHPYAIVYLIFIVIHGIVSAYLYDIVMHYLVFDWGILKPQSGSWNTIKVDQGWRFCNIKLKSLYLLTRKNWKR